MSGLCVLGGGGDGYGKTTVDLLSKSEQVGVGIGDGADC